MLENGVRQKHMARLGSTLGIIGIIPKSAKMAQKEHLMGKRTILEISDAIIALK